MKRSVGYFLLFTISCLAIAAIVAILLYARSKAPGTGGGRPGGPTPVIVAEVQKREFVDAIEAIGTARSNESVTITSKVTDTVRRIHFRDGDTVDEGDLLIELADEQAQAALAEAHADLEDQEKSLRRTETLVRNRSLPQSQLDEQRALYHIAKARVTARQADVDDRRIAAPFSGRLGLRMVSPGSLVTPGTEITTLDDIAIIKLDFSVPESFLSAVMVGQPVSARSVAYPDKQFRGEVVTISPRIDPIARSVNVRAHIDNPDHLLRPGMLLTLNLERDRSETILIPEEAIVPIEDRTYVYKVIDDKARRVQVQTGRRQPGFVEITDGLEPGVVIITEGAMRVRDGGDVRIQRTREIPTTAGATRERLPKA